MANISYKSASTLTNRYGWNGGNEYEDEGELNYSNTFYRKYDAQIGRFTGVDSKAEATVGLNPYHFGGDNPVMFNDPMGDLSQADWNDLLSRLGSGYNLNGFGEFGGSYSSSGGGGFNAFRSEAEAFGAGVAYMNNTDSWGKGEGWAKSFGQALGRFIKTSNIEQQVKDKIFDRQYSGAGRLVRDFFTDIFKVPHDKYRIGESNMWFTTQEKDEDGQFLINVNIKFLEAFANGTVIDAKEANFIPTFSDVVRSIFHEGEIHVSQNLGLAGFEKGGAKLELGAAREMQAYYGMLFNNLSGVGPPSSGFMRHELGVFLRQPTTGFSSGNTIPSYQLMNSSAQQRWSVQYFTMFFAYYKIF